MHTVLFINNLTTNGGQMSGQSTDVHSPDIRHTDDRPIIIMSLITH